MSGGPLTGCWLIAWSVVAPTIMTVEGFEESELFVQNRRRLLIRRLLYGRCDKVAVCSKTLYRIAIDKWRLQPPMLLHIPNGVDCRRFMPSAKPQCLTGEVRLGIVASLIKLKGHLSLLRCFRELSEHMDISLQVAGDGPELENLRQFCNENGLNDRVQFIGHVNDTPLFPQKIGYLLPCVHNGANAHGGP